MNGICHTGMLEYSGDCNCAILMKHLVMGNVNACANAFLGRAMAAMVGKPGEAGLRTPSMANEMKRPVSVRYYIVRLIAQQGC